MFCRKDCWKIQVLGKWLYLTSGLVTMPYSGVTWDLHRFKRFYRDALDQSSVKWLVIMEGVNDLWITRDSVAAFQVAENQIVHMEK